MNKSMFITGIIACIIAGVCLYFTITTYRENRDYISTGKIHSLENALAQGDVDTDGCYYRVKPHYVLDKFYTQEKKFLGIPYDKVYYYAIMTDDYNMYFVAVPQNRKAEFDEIAFADSYALSREVTRLLENKVNKVSEELKRIDISGKYTVVGDSEVSGKISDYIAREGLDSYILYSVHPDVIDITAPDRIFLIFKMIVLSIIGFIFALTGISSIMPKNLASYSTTPSKPKKVQVRKPMKKGPKDKYDDIDDSLTDGSETTYTYSTSAQAAPVVASKEEAYSFSSNTISEEETAPLTFDGMLTKSSDENGEALDIKPIDDLVDMADIKEAGPIELGSSDEEVSLDGSEDKEVELIKFDDDNEATSVSI